MKVRQRAKVGSGRCRALRARPGLFGDSGSRFGDRLHEFAGRSVDKSGAFLQAYERREAIVEPPVWLLVGEAGEAAEVAPVGARRIAAEAGREFFRNARAQLAIENAAVVQPRLEVARRGFDKNRGLEARGLHAHDGIGAEIVEKAQGVFAVRPDEYVRAARVFVFQP